jgi:uncharacterized Zn finger protein
VRSECSCPDKANPCKHVSAVFYLMGDRFSEDPFVLFQLRGRTRAQLLSDLAKRRRRALAKQARQARARGEEDAATAGAHQPVHGAITDPSRWWRYDAALDPDLVVITPALEGDTALDAAGPLPLAEAPWFPEANQRFLAHVREHGQALASQALARAMEAPIRDGDAAAA